MNIMKELNHYLDEVKEIANTVSREDITKAINVLNDARKSNKKIFIIGNGGSASTATHFACDLNKYVSVDGKKRFKALSLEDNIPLLTALVNDEGWDSVYRYQLENLMDKGDCLVVISVHGGSGKDHASLWSQNLLQAAKLIQENGGKVIGLVGFDGGVMKKIADVCITVPINSTPQVEGFHLVLTHMICSIVKDRLANE
jgi:D-sedoheptulose 7-phosphate isomerase